MAAPNVVVMVVQASVGLIETYFVGKLGTDALAGVTLVFPVLMLMPMMSACAMGGGISSSIARVLGCGRRADADAPVQPALAISLLFVLVRSVEHTSELQLQMRTSYAVLRLTNNTQKN